MADRGLSNDVAVQTLLRDYINFGYLKKSAMIFRVPKPENCLTKSGVALT